jgi:hypothetical protein
MATKKKQHAETENDLAQEKFRLERQQKQQVQKEHKQVLEEKELQRQNAQEKFRLERQQKQQVQKEHKQVLEEKELQRQNATSVLERLMMKEKRRRIITAIKVQAHLMHEMKKPPKAPHHRKHVTIDVLPFPGPRLDDLQHQVAPAHYRTDQLEEIRRNLADIRLHMNNNTAEEEKEEDSVGSAVKVGQSDKDKEIAKEIEKHAKGNPHQLFDLQKALKESKTVDTTASSQSFHAVFCQGRPSKDKITMLGHQMNHVVTIISNFAVGGQADPSAVMSRIFLCLGHVFRQPSEVSLPGAVKLSQQENENMAEWLGQAHSFMEDLPARDQANHHAGQVEMRDVKAKVGILY